MELRGIVLGDRYRLDRRIAAGSMGQVWQAYDEVLERQVAVKLLRPEYTEHLQTLERFRAEARHAGALNHPHIAQVYDYQHSGLSRGPYLVMEYVDGPSLAEVIERGPLSASLTCDVIAQAAAALDAAHKAGLVHRDIKPGNMLLTPDGRVKITDFGIAHAAGSAPITAPGIVVGTSLYMAPERIAGGPGTPASDLYSLGVVMWECLAGRPPFQGSSADLMAAHLHQAMPPLPDRVPGPLCDLVGRLTAKDPKHRISDAGLLAVQARSLQLAGAGALAHDGDLHEGRSPAAGLYAPGESASTDGPAVADGTDGEIAPAGRARQWGRRHGAMVVLAAAVVAAGLGTAALAANGLFSAAPRANPGTSAALGGMAPGRSASSVLVPASLVGQQLDPVLTWLRAHGLNYRIEYAAGTGQPTGMVTSVTPQAPVPPGTTIIVTAALGGGTAPGSGVAGKPTAGQGAPAAPRAPGSTSPSSPASSGSGGSASPGIGSTGTTSPTTGGTPSPGTSGSSSPSPSSSPGSGSGCLLGIVCL